jgi:predicted HAD superfamily Cof-like phosphohydrolase
MRSKTNYEKVREFHKAFGSVLDQKLKQPILDFETASLVELRYKLIDEEYKEVTDTSTLENLLKELTDLLYVIYGFAATFGWDIDTAFNRVHMSNMSKLGADGKPIYREDGKVLKGPNYKPAYLGDLV